MTKNFSDFMILIISMYFSRTKIFHGTISMDSAHIFFTIQHTLSKTDLNLKGNCSGGKFFFFLPSIDEYVAVMLRGKV